MNSKILVLAAFGAWTVFCSWWYVCKIKQACGDRPAATEAAADAFVNVAPVPLDTAAPAEPPLRPQESSTNTNIEAVQVIENAEGAVIHFPYNSTKKEDDEAVDDYLSRLADALIRSGQRAIVTGHTDGIGDPQSNRLFAEQRAMHIRAILLKKGVPHDQIRVRSLGETRPVASNDTPQGRYQNRRVEIKIAE